jgi:hypothetical protein
MSLYAATVLISVMIAASSAGRSAALQTTLSSKQTENHHTTRERYRFGYVYTDCGNISIAHYIVLTARTARCNKPPSGTHLEITLQCCQEIPQTFDLSRWNGTGISASRCIVTGHYQGEDCVYATSGQVRLAKLDAKGAAGEYDLSFADGDHKSGRFEVKTCKRKRQTLCE